jgi:phospholipid/cholesterol/gamma-HCH transport system ATP-binding protein
MADAETEAKPPKTLAGGQLFDHSEGRELVLKLRDVRTQFGDSRVHNHLDFDVFRGEVVGLVGGSGTGKSVLLRTILGLNPARKGRIEVRGHCTSRRWHQTTRCSRCCLLHRRPFCRAARRRSS